jgi:ABC-type multidrug transport system permease subunit
MCEASKPNLYICLFMMVFEAFFFGLLQGIESSPQSNMEIVGSTIMVMVWVAFTILAFWTAIALEIKGEY